MKRLIIPLLALCGVFSCSTDDDKTVHVPNGYYASFSETQYLCVHIENGYCSEIIVYNKDDKMLSRVIGFSTNGDWPNYEYACHGIDTTVPEQSEVDFTMSATFNNEATTFVSNYSGIVVSRTYFYWNDEIKTLTLEGKGVKFTLTDEPIDTNGDGIPDVME